MTNEIFPHPHDDESAEDPFTGPADSYSEQSLGASPMNPVAAARQPKRRLALFAIAGSIALLAVFFLFSIGGNDSRPLDEPVITGQVDTPAQAELPTQPTRRDISELGAPPQSRPQLADRSDLNLLDPNRLDTGVGGPSQPGNMLDPSSLQPSSVLPTGDPNSPVYGSSSTGPQTRPDWTLDSPGGGHEPPPGALTDEEIERQARLDAMRVAAERARAEAEALEEARKAEEERLRGKPTLVAEASGLLDAGHGSAQAPGSSRFGLDEQEPDVTSDSGASSTSTNPDIVPGTRVAATLVSEFISDAEGGGRVEARLNEPLRSRGRTLLPAGTRAYGAAQATHPTPGRQARVQLVFNIFVTPDGRVVRDITGHAADPETLASSVPGKVDNRYLDRIARGTISTAVDLALTQHANDRRSAFEVPSARDMAIDDARRRLGAIINGPIGDETSVPAAVRLEPGTKLVLIFGF